jgi:predicted Zn-ribbon and HTH transcriptional regulator
MSPTNPQKQQCGLLSRLRQFFATSSKPRPRCGNCGYQFFTREVDGMVFCIRCHALNIVSPDSPGKP